MKTSISPVGIFGLTSSGARAFTSPSIRITHSGPHPLDRAEGRAVAVAEHLRHAVMVAQVDEEHPAVVADPMHPARKAHRLPHVRTGQGGTGMAAIAMHGGLSR
jgi:hypothetical protein